MYCKIFTNQTKVEISLTDMSSETYYELIYLILGLL
jgi:hypothetical protein